GERGVTRERHLEGRREDAHMRAGPGRWKDERRLRQIELQRQCLHGGIVETATVLEHRQRIAGETFLGEHVDDAKGVIGHQVPQLATCSLDSKSVRTSSASAANAAGVISRASTTL